MKTLHNYHQVWKQYGFTPEFYNIPKSEAHTSREGYPLRPGKFPLTDWIESSAMHEGGGGAQIYRIFLGKVGLPLEI